MPMFCPTWGCPNYGRPRQASTYGDCCPYCGAIFADAPPDADAEGSAAPPVDKPRNEGARVTSRPTSPRRAGQAGPEIGRDSNAD